MRKLTTISHDGEEFNVFHINRKMCAIEMGEYSVACSSLVNRIIYVFDEFNNLSEDSKRVVLLREIAHLNGIVDDMKANAFVLQITGIRIFTTAFYEIRNILFKSKPMKRREISEFIKSKLEILNHKDII